MYIDGCTAYQFGFNKLVDNKMDHCLADSEIACRNTFIEGRQSTLRIHSFDALSHRHLHFGIVVQLHSRLHKPNGIRGRG